MAQTLIDAAKWWATHRQDTRAIICGTESLTFGEYDRWADGVCGWLIEQGLQVGDRVTIFAANSIEWMIASHAVLLAGGLLAPVSPRFTVSEASYLVVDRYQSRFIFHDAAHAATILEVASQLPDTKTFDLSVIRELRGRAGGSSALRREAIGDDTPVVIIPTSGSTGHPKGVVYSHRTILAYILQFALAEPHAADRAKIILFAPMSTSAGYVVSTQFLASGGSVYIENAFDPKRALAMIEQERITVLMGAPVFLERIAALPEFASTDLTSIRMAIVGGAPVSRELLEIWRAKGVVVRQLYGQTEAGGLATINTPADALTHPEKCGPGMPFTRVATIDETGGFCGPDVPGEIVIQGPANMVGYWADPEATSRTVVDGWLRTGDLGVVDETGSVTMIDRLKDIIISGGLNISAAEVERIIMGFGGIDEVAVIAAKDERFGETPLAIFHSPTGNRIHVADLIAWCNKHLSDFKVPRYLVQEDDPLPRLATGKIAKPQLRKKYADAASRLQRVR